MTDWAQWSAVVVLRLQVCDRGELLRQRQRFVLALADNRPPEFSLLPQALLVRRPAPAEPLVGRLALELGALAPARASAHAKGDLSCH